MAEFTLDSVLHSLVYPTTIRISSGSLTTEEGKHFRPFKVLTLYGNGLRVYVPPSDNAALRERCRTADTTERTRRTSDDIVAIDEEYTNADNLFTKNIFISEKASIKDNNFAGKVYRDAVELFIDLPFAVKANKSFFVSGERTANEMRKISEGDVMYIAPQTEKVSRNILRGHVDGDRVSIHLSNTSLNVTALPGPNPETTVTSRSVSHLMRTDIQLPKEMVFEDRVVQETYQIEVGINVIPLREQPLHAVCCSERRQHGGNIVKLDNEMLSIQNVWCFSYSEHTVKSVKVQVLDVDRKSSFKPAFGKEVDSDKGGFSLYNLYGKASTVDYVKRTVPPGSTVLATDQRQNRNLLAQDIDTKDTNGKDVKAMTIAELADLFRQYRLPHMATICEKEYIDGVILACLDEDDLTKEPFNLTGLSLLKVRSIMEGHSPKI